MDGFIKLFPQLWRGVNRVGCHGQQHCIWIREGGRGGKEGGRI